jgi:surface-adhesin protein E
MTRLLLITLLMLSSELAYAEWMAVGGNEEAGVTVYADLGTIRRKGNLVKMWELFDHKTTQNIGVGLFMSRKGQREYDCTKERYRLLTFMQFSGNMGSGTVGYSSSGEGRWIPVQPGSLDQSLWKLACDKK